MAMNVNFYEVEAKGGQTAAERYAALTKDPDSFYLVSSDLYLGTTKLSNGDDLATAVENISKNAADITTINNTLTMLQNSESTNGSIRNIIRGYLDALDSTATVASKSGNVVTINPQVVQTNGSIAAAGAAITLAEVAVTGAAANVSYDGTVSSLSAVTVQGAIDAIAQQSAGGVGSKTVYVTETAGQGSDPFSKRYGVYQGGSGSASSPVAGEKLVDIDIPKDMVVESGTVGTVTVPDEPYAGAAVGDKYIDLTIANATSDHIYIPANSLVDIYTAEQGAAQIQITIDNSNEISAVIVAGSVTATELAANAVTTAKIADSNVTKAKLSAEVQASLDKADTAIQSVTEGTTAGAILVGSSVVPVHGLADVATSGNADDVAYDNTESGMTATDMQAAVDELKDAIDNIDVSGDIDAAIEALDTPADIAIASVSGSIVTIAGGIMEEDGIVKKTSAGDIVLAKVAKTGKAEDVALVDADNNFTTDDVESALAEIAEHLCWRTL